MVKTKHATVGVAHNHQSSTIAVSNRTHSVAKFRLLRTKSVIQCACDPTLR